MTDRMLIGHLTPGPAGLLKGSRPEAASPERSDLTGNKGRTSFKQLLAREQLHFSQHAEQRLLQRGIVLQPEQLDRIASAVEQAAAKGAKDSLVLYRDIAMIVNVPNRTVVTAMDGSSMKDHIFTKIDSAVVVA
ncbi:MULTISPECIES: TIGR02530 family flagellar biosynthesis protein [Cohnella]|uniref:TIGR02530 family flagellar biosynthesis protein n=1 Tax=Cohnella TaxID=329857 RepID=UPI0009BC5CB1|nr:MULTISPECIES: TIGR02530 family flagellar biosynthesis protein [Cohnella]MBN2983602.1 flagellar biosynthesis protein [Cohnella algarum]